MLKKLIGFFVVILSASLISFINVPDAGEISGEASGEEMNVNNVYSFFYSVLKSNVPKPDYEAFSEALTGFFNLKAAGQIKNNLLTIIDFSISSSFERMWIIDIQKMAVIHLSLVAHGRNSGDEFASHFSNKPSSYQSSLGFYLTGGIYNGRNGMSLYLDGVEPGVNDKARERSIVMHGADYVSKKFISIYGRLGRSFGCPSIPLKDHETIMKLLSGGSCLFIYYPDDKYRNNSKLLTNETALAGMNILLGEAPDVFENFTGFNLLAVSH